MTTKTTEYDALVNEIDITGITSLISNAASYQSEMNAKNITTLDTQLDSLSDSLTAAQTALTNIQTLQ